MSLNDLQQSWQQSTFEESATGILPFINESEERAMIYVDAYRARLIEALEKIFPQLLAKIGDDEFCRLALDYIDANPSEYYSIGSIGEGLSGFVVEAYRDTAELDWAISIALDSGDAKPSTKALLQEIPQEQWADILFELHPSVSVLKSQRVWRKGTQVYYISLEGAEKVFLDGILQKLTFGEICEKLADILPEEEVVNYAIQQLLRWLDDEIITNAIIKENA